MSPELMTAVTYLVYIVIGLLMLGVLIPLSVFLLGISMGILHWILGKIQDIRWWYRNTFKIIMRKKLSDQSMGPEGEVPHKYNKGNGINGHWEPYKTLETLTWMEKHIFLDRKY